MPDDPATAATTPQSTEPQGSGDQTTSGTPSGDNPPKTGAQDTGFRYTKGPDWAQGKTPEEMLTIAEQLYEATIQGVAPQVPQQQMTTAWPQNQSMAAPPQAQPQQVPQPQAPQQVIPPTQDDYITDPASATQRAIEYARQTEFAPAMQQFQTSQAQYAREMASMKYPDDFKRYGPEIDVMLKQVDPTQLNPFVVDKVVQMVRANHIDELADERAQAKIDQMSESGQLLRPGTGQSTTVSTPSSVDLNSDDLPESYRRHLTKMNIDSSKLDEFLGGPAGKEFGVSLEERRKKWFELASAGEFVTEESL